MSINMVKIGVVSCSGEDCLGGTISRPGNPENAG